MGPAPLGRTSEKRKVSAHWEVPSLAGRSAGMGGGLQSLRREHSNRSVEGRVERDLHRR